MDLRMEVMNFILMFLLMVLGSLYLRWRGLVSARSAPALAKLTTEFIIPALIISKLSKIQLDALTIQAASVMILAELSIMVLAYLLGRFLFKLSPQSLSAFILCSTFGSTAMLGNAFIKAVFHDDLIITASSLVIGQLGVGVPNNILGPILTLELGNDRNLDIKHRLQNALLNPVLISVLFGLTWGALGIPTQGFLITPVFEALRYCGETLPFLAAIITGLSLTKFSLKGMIPLIIACCLFQLVGLPFVTHHLLEYLSQPVDRQQLIFLLGALPSSPLAVAFAVQYGGNAKLASVLVMSTTVASMISLPLLIPVVTMN